MGDHAVFTWGVADTDAARYHPPVIEIPKPYSTYRAAAATGEVAYGVIGLELYDLNELEAAEIG